LPNSSSITGVAETEEDIREWLTDPERIGLPKDFVDTLIA